MIAAHEKKANIAAGVWIATLLMLVAMFVTGYAGNIWDNGDIFAITLFSIHGLSLLVALWFYAKAKGYWGILGAVLFVLNWIGLCILLLLPDRSIHQPQPAE